MGKIIAGALQGELDVVLVRTLRAPQHPELAVGAINEQGWTYVADFAEMYGGTPDHIASEKRIQMRTLKDRRARYTPVRPPIDATGRIVIVVDDGLATGASMMAALHGLKTQKLALLVCAVPVAPTDTLARMAELVDDVVCLETPASFQAVGQFYRDFPQVTDDEVMALLEGS